MRRIRYGLVEGKKERWIPSPIHYKIRTILHSLITIGMFIFAMHTLSTLYP